MKNNAGNSFKRFITNKNTVTFLGVILGVVVLFFGYNYRIDKAVNPVIVPIAKVEIAGKEKITDDKLTTIKISQEELNKLEGLITRKSDLLNKFVSHNTLIPKNGFFYKSVVVEENHQPNYISDNMCDDCSIFTLDTSALSDYGSYGTSSIMPNDVVDIYVRARSTKDTSKTYYSRIVAHAEVMAVRDSSGNDAFAGGNTNKAHTYVFTLPSKVADLLNLGTKISGIDFIMVPRNRKYAEEEKETAIVSADLEKYIRSFQEVVSDDAELIQ